jgi:hypothetical protein
MDQNLLSQCYEKVFIGPDVEFYKIKNKWKMID